MVALAACTIVAAQKMGYRGSRPYNSAPSQVIGQFSARDFLKTCFPKATIHSGSSRGDRVEKLAAWYELQAQVSASGEGLEDPNVVSSTLHAKLQDFIDTAVGPTKMASGGGSTCQTGSLRDAWYAHGYVFDSPNRCVGHISAHCISTGGTWLFVFDAVEVPQ
jgi:hypothetical protein